MGLDRLGVHGSPAAGSRLCAIAIHANLILQLFEPIEEAEGVIQLLNEQVKLREKLHRSSMDRSTPSVPRKVAGF